MALTATFSTGGDFEVAEEGRYVCRITDVKAEERPSFDDPNVMEPNFVWDYETVRDMDSKGNPYRFRQFTKTAYGNEKANLTLLINALFGRAFLKEQVAQMDFEKLIGKEVAVMVALTPSNRNKVLSVKPLPGKSITFEDVVMEGADERMAPPRKSKAPVTDDDGIGDDPFADN